MTYLGHVAFRHLLEEMGHKGLMFSEMCSAARIPQENRRVSAYFRWRDEEAARLIVQIVGADPAKMAAAAQRIESEGFFGVDINLGCSVKGICRFNQGAALLKEPDTAVRIVHRVRQAVRCPVTVKFRIGWQDNPHTPIEMARRLEDAGADALTFHPRIAPDRRSRPPRWEYITRVKQAVSIPIFGNGNVFSADDCLKMLNTTGCDGIALGRLAIAQPWAFRWWLQGVQPPESILRNTALRLCGLLSEHFDTMRALRRYKRYAAYLSANFAFGNHLYNGIQKAADFGAIEAVLIDFFNNEPQILKRPNINFLH
jgi:nifR3 family TIM-barrel protein